MTSPSTIINYKGIMLPVTEEMVKQVIYSEGDGTVSTFKVANELERSVEHEICVSHNTGWRIACAEKDVIVYLKRAEDLGISIPNPVSYLRFLELSEKREFKGRLVDAKDFFRFLQTEIEAIYAGLRGCTPNTLGLLLKTVQVGAENAANQPLQ